MMCKQQRTQWNAIGSRQWTTIDTERKLQWGLEWIEWERCLAELHFLFT